MYIRSAFILKATVRLPELPLSIIHTCASRAARSGPTCCSPTTSTSRKEELLIQHSCTSPVFNLRIERHTRLKTILRQFFTKMGCNGFTCSKHSLCALNILYIMVSLLMIGIAAWGKWFGLVSSFQVVGGVIGVGVFLFFVAMAGLIGAMKHHQVLLFFYMTILSIVFIVQFSVSSACLAITKEQQDHLLEVGWNNSESTQRDVEKSINCCGFKHVDPNGTCAADCFPNHTCLPCADKIQEHTGKVLHLVGVVALSFSFTEILGVWLTYRYRNQKDPRANPGAFL
ncbi:tetraspanin-13b [Cynoglossus semilaevis]|uniref:Tetraspanin 13b n=1 Tax=Cynoglossus semilaevis TaxID=244447 RepID=A0A3P8WQR4_CYNSE|nr:tetraspanin-13 [Cynoglossus semilaevis]